MINVWVSIGLFNRLGGNGKKKELFKVNVNINVNAY